MQGKFVLVASVVLLLVSVAGAHEVYVLPDNVTEQGTAADSPDPFTAIEGKEPVFAALSIFGLLVVIAVFLAGRLQQFDEHVSPVLAALQPHAPMIVRVTLGLGLIATATSRHLFGPEIPLSVVTADPRTFSMALYLIGALLLLNLETRLTSFTALAVFLLAAGDVGPYMVHYAGYLGLILFVFLREEQPYLDDFLSAYLKLIGKPAQLVRNADTPYLILRILYGTSIIYAAVYAKYLHSNLALATIEQHGLAQLVPFDPLFIVLGAFLLELVIGVCFLVGFELRFATLLLIGVNIISFLVFQEALWPHIVLVGTAIAIAVHGYDDYTVGGWLLQKWEQISVLK